MPSLSVSHKRRKEQTKSKLKTFRNHDEFLSRIKKTLYYGKLPSTDRLSLPVSELAAEIFSEVKHGYSLDYLNLDDATTLSRNACVSPCSLVLAFLYLERLKTCNPDYLQKVGSSELFLVSMMVASKFLHDDGEEDEVFNDEWAASAGISLKYINNLERDFLSAIDWEVFVSEQSFWKQLLKVERIIALQEGKRRGWFSYTDLDSLLSTVDLSALTQAFLTVSVVSLASYTASILALLGSVLIVSHIPGTCINSRLSGSSPETNIVNTPLNDSCDVLHSDTLLLDNPTSLDNFSNIIFTSTGSYSKYSPNNPIFKTLDSDLTRYSNDLDDCAHNTRLWVLRIVDFVKEYLFWHWWEFQDRRVNSYICNTTNWYRLPSRKNCTSSLSTEKKQYTRSIFSQTREEFPELLKWLLIITQKSTQSMFLPLELVAS